MFCRQCKALRGIYPRHKVGNGAEQKWAIPTSYLNAIPGLRQWITAFRQTHAN